MTMVIWKKILLHTHKQTVSLPKGATILCVGNQREEICLWFQFQAGQNFPTEDRTILIVGTGHETDFDGKYLGTCFMQGGPLVFHIFEGAT